MRSTDPVPAERSHLACQQISATHDAAAGALNPYSPSQHERCGYSRTEFCVPLHRHDIRPGDRVADMDVALLYFDGCPNHHATLTLLEALLIEAGWDGDVRLINVDSQSRAEELSFRGSPTVLINGRDPFRGTEAPVGLSCRIYATDEGFRGTPPEPELKAAITRSMGD